MGKTKYSNALKMRVVQYCIEGHHGYVDAARHFNINSKTSVMKWVRKYKEHGGSGLLRNIKISYSGEFKQNVVEYMRMIIHIQVA